MFNAIHFSCQTRVVPPPHALWPGHVSSVQFPEKRSVSRRVPHSNAAVRCKTMVKRRQRGLCLLPRKENCYTCTPWGGGLCTSGRFRPRRIFQRRTPRGHFEGTAVARCHQRSVHRCRVEHSRATDQRPTPTPLSGRLPFDATTIFHSPFCEALRRVGAPNLLNARCGLFFFFPDSM